MSIDLKALENEIQKRGYEWEVEDNHMTQKHPNVRKRMNGVVRPPVKDPHPLPEHQAGDPDLLPSQFSWVNNDGIDYVTSVKDQGACGSCVGFACTAAMESMVAIGLGKDDRYDLSVADAFFCGATEPSCGGWWPGSFFYANLQRGLIPDILFPYASAFAAGGPVCHVLPERNENAFHYGTLTAASTVDATKDYLVNVGPITACFQVFEDFYAYKRGVYKHVSGSSEGFHCVCIVGFNDNDGDGYWICKNSWSTDWGMQGYFNIAYGQCSIDAIEKYGVTDAKPSALDIPKNVFLTTQGMDGIWEFSPFSDNAPKLIPSSAGLGFQAGSIIGDSLYLTGQGGGLYQYDLLLRVKSILVPGTEDLGFRSIAGVGQTAYLTTQGRDGIWKWDVLGDAAPRQIHGTSGLGFRGVTAVDSTLYLTTQGADGLWKCDGSNPPTQIPGTQGLGFRSITAVGQTLYMTTQGSDGVWQYQIGSSLHPQQVRGTAGLGFQSALVIGDNLFMVPQGKGIWYGYRLDLNDRAFALMPSTAPFGFREMIPLYA